MFKELLKTFFNYKFSFNAVKRHNAANISDLIRVNELKREVPIVVCMSAKEDDFEELELSLYSIFEQTVLPDRVVLWMSNEYELSELPYSITRYRKNGLEVRFVEDKGSYNDIIYALKEFSNSILVTAEADFYYPKNWLKKLYHSYISEPKDIHVHQAWVAEYKEDSILPMKLWKKNCEENSLYRNFPIREAGVLYPPKCFSVEVFRDDLFVRKLKIDSSVWFWFMAVVSGRKTRVVKNYINRLTCINLKKQVKKYAEFNKKLDSFDSQISSLIKYYGQNVISKLKQG